jgi:hypothetical protein
MTLFTLVNTLFEIKKEELSKSEFGFNNLI